MNDLGGAIKMIASLPAAKAGSVVDTMSNGGKLTCICDKKKLLDITDVETVCTPYVKGIDRTCVECRKDVKGLCKVLCAGCKEVIAFVAPGKDEDGFVRVPGAVYHVVDCPTCNPDRFSKKEVVTIFAEKASYMKRVKGISLDHWL
jgi:hypothetical protein